MNDKVKYYCKEDLENILISKFSDILKRDTSIKYTDALVDDNNSEFVLDNADVFRQGVCQLFAYELHEKFGYDVYKIKVDKSFHIFCKSDDGEKYIDVRGIATDFKEFINGSDVAYTQDDTSKLYEFEKDDLNGEYYDIGLAFARIIIYSDLVRYKV